MYALLNRHNFSMNQSTLIEIGLVVLFMIMSFFIKKIVDNKIITPLSDSAKLSKKRFLMHYSYVSYPLYFAVLLAISLVILSSLGSQVKIIAIFGQFSLIWFCLRVITALSGSKSPKLVVISIAFIIILDIFDLTDIVVVSLEKISIEFGTFRLSAFLVTRVIFAIIISFWVISLISKITKRVVSNFKNLNKSAKNLTTVVIDTILYLMLFMFLLRIAGFDITTVAVIGSAIGIGIGFGLQKITSNFMSGLILLFEKSIKEGDVIELSSSPSDIGFVKHLGIRYTLVQTFDNKEIMIPNEDFITNKVINWTFSDKEVRVKVDIGVSYDEDMDLVKKLILEAGNENDDDQVAQKPVCFMTEFGDSSVNFILFVWVSKVSLVPHQKRSDILFSIWNKFEAHNIRIPYPQTDINYRSNLMEEAKK